MKIIYSALGLLITTALMAQQGGSSSFAYLKLPTNAKATALGGTAAALQDYDVLNVYENPSLADSILHKTIAFNNGFYLKGSIFGRLGYAHYAKNLKGTFTTGINYQTYGNFDGRDIAGNPTGNFRAGDYGLYGSYSQQWKNFHYGITTQILFSNYAQYSSIAIAWNLGASYIHKKKKLLLTAYLKDAGIQVKPYVLEKKEKLPLQLNLGLSKTFVKLPITLQVIVHDLQSPDLTFPIEDKNNLFTGQSSIKKTSFLDKTFRHFIFGANIAVAKPVHLRIGYDHLDRKALSIEGKKGLSGLSAGFGIHIQAFDFDYGIAPYSGGNILHHLGLQVRLSDFGITTN